MKANSFDIRPIGAADRLLLAGPSAIASTLEAFVQGRDLDWAEQVTVLATLPAYRHLAAVGAGDVQRRRLSVIVDADEGNLRAVRRPTNILHRVGEGAQVTRVAAVGIDQRQHGLRIFGVSFARPIAQVGQ